MVILFFCTDIEIDRAQKAGGLQLVVFRPMMPCGEGDAARGARFAFLEPLRPCLEGDTAPFDVRRELFVADEAVDPAVRHFNPQIVLPFLQKARDVDAVGRLPEDAAVVAVDEDAGVDHDVAKIQQQRRIGRLRRQIKGFRIGGSP